MTVWCSGCTNELGVIVNGSERLPSELFDVYKDGARPATLGYPAACNNAVPQHYQPHFFTGSPITRQDQVQIYEELNLNIQCAMTTSFLRRDYQLKDNRLLPFGWTMTGPLNADKTPPTGPATQRLYYLTSNLQTKGTSIEDWKFQIATASEVATR